MTTVSCTAVLFSALFVDGFAEPLRGVVHDPLVQLICFPSSTVGVPLG